MPQQSLRRYLTENELQERVTVTTFNLQTLIQAEIDIDNIIADFFQGSFRKALITESKFDSVVINSNTATITALNSQNEYYSRTVLEVLTGTHSGSRFAVQSQSNQTLTFWESSELTNVVCSVRLYQLAKAPFYKDFGLRDNIYYKVIDERVKEAVALQYFYRQENPEIFGSNYPVKNYSVSKDSYSENYDTARRTGLIDRIHPDAYSVLESLTVQSLT